MLFSRLLIPTSKETPKDAVLKSHQFLVRGGYIHQMGSGIYSLLPLGKMVLDNIARIIRTRMNEAGAQEVLLSFVTPAELWKESGRYEKYGKELLRFVDRKNNEFVLGPTHEESITQLAKTYIKSYKSLPINLYHIQLKFRDELRPRFGLMRTREFLMKDAYSFHSSVEDLDKEFENMHRAYSQIFSDLGLDFRVVEADSGAIGGSGSKEFMVLADSGEDTLVVCESCEYAANLEAAKRQKRPELENPPKAEFALFPTPNVKTIDDVCKFFHIEPYFALKAVVKKFAYKLDSNALDKNAGAKKSSAESKNADSEAKSKGVDSGEASKNAESRKVDSGEASKNAESASSIAYDFAVFFLRGDDSLDDTKALNALSKNGFDAIEILEASEGELKNLGLIAGSIGAVGLRTIIGERAIIFDEDLRDAQEIICGGNQQDTHFVGVDFSSFQDMVYAPLSVVREGDICACCGGKLAYKKGIEVGHIFKLGDKYSSALKAEYLDENARPTPFIMGCYGIGVTRLLPAILEQKADVKGCVWSETSAPFVVQIIIANVKDSAQYEFGMSLYEGLRARGVEVLCDDRDARFGAKMADFELVGLALFGIVIGKGLESGNIECVKREGLEKKMLLASNALEQILQEIAPAIEARNATSARDTRISQNTRSAQNASPNSAPNNAPRATTPQGATPNARQ
ncbi:proline--tRNA ligase [Helicobacter sp. CLO-3]|uniref:proline--tRNA ligase n=1 Tax=Helicobacter sp. CLO-3 TaxID=211 RepID=UPI0008057D28|nr:proline--tRNA ligase [Helicobacter sp. CLO-3]OBV29611.1 proline--tRNA ligase [Helicobacter sp. CLO-3]